MVAVSIIIAIAASYFKVFVKADAITSSDNRILV